MFSLAGARLPPAWPQDVPWFASLPLPPDTVAVLLGYEVNQQRMQ